MLSTGEVACFGENYQEAYLKALSATGFKAKNKCNVLVSLGSIEDKQELSESIKLLGNNGFTLFGTTGTAKYYSELEIPITGLSSDKINGMIKEGVFGLVINTSVYNRLGSTNKTNGYFIRRLSIDYGIDIIINIKCKIVYLVQQPL